MAPGSVDLVVLDLDGTLLNSQKNISVRNARAVQRALAAGIDVVIATARPPRSARRYADELGLPGFGVFYNGALVATPDLGAIHRHDPIPVQAALEFLDLCLSPPGRGKGRPVPVAGPVPSQLPENIIVEVLDRYYTWRLDAEIVQFVQRSGIQPAGVGDLRRFLKEPVSKIAVRSAHGRSRLARLADQMFAGRLSWTQSDRATPWIEFMNAGVSKAHAMASLAREREIPWERIAAFGDESNDIELLRFAGVGVAMGNAAAAVRKAARLVTETNDADGVAAVLERLAP